MLDGEAIRWWHFTQLPGALKTSLSLNNVENTALSTWAGSANITTLGTIATGSWAGSAITETHGGTNQTAYTKGDILVASAANTLSRKAVGVNGSTLVSNSNAATGNDYYYQPPQLKVRSGRYLITPCYAAVSTATLTLGTIYFSPVVVYEPQTFTAMGFCPVVTTTTSYKLGVYTDVGGVPSGLPISGSTVTVGPLTTAAATSEDATFASPILFTPGRYFIAVLSDTTGTHNVVGSAAMANVYGTADMTTVNGTRYTFSQAYASGLPDMTSNTTAFGTANNGMLLGLKAQ